MKARQLTSAAATLFTLLLVGGGIRADDGSCVVEKERPPLDIPWSDVDELCAADFGQGADLVPPTGLDRLQAVNAYAEKVQSFLRQFEYRDLGWLHDARWRLTGDWAGCPDDTEKQWTNETHPLVRIYYSPEVMEWLCKYRRDTSAAHAEAGDLPPGAVIVKEMQTATDAALAYRPNTGSREALGKLWVDGQAFDDATLSWTVMIKGTGSYDGWYWATFSQPPTAYAADAETYNPPILDRSGFATPVDPQTGYPLAVGGDGLPELPEDQVPPPTGPWYPTFWNLAIQDVVFSNYGYGSYCIYCHGSAVSQSTFASLDNLLGEEIESDYLKEIPPSPGSTRIVSEHRKLPIVAQAEPSSASDNPRSPFPPYDPLNVPDFEKMYPQFAGLSYDDVWPDRLPSEVWDHSVAGVHGPDQFLTSDQCLACHGAGGPSQRLPNMVVVDDDDTQVNLTPHAEWRVSPMGLAGRDPVFYAMLESELNRADREQGLEPYVECIQNTCLHCHGNMGQRQWAIDTQGPEDDPCADFEPVTDPTSDGTWSPAERREAGYGGEPFLRDYLKAWRGEDPQHARFGGLGRDGISCTTCHHVSARDLGRSGKTFTGNFRAGPADELYGPFEENLKTEPMELALGITPTYGEHLTKSELCGSCHTIYLPVFDNQGRLLRAGFEQTTYLEWLNSAFNNDNHNFPARDWRTCQECHMRDHFDYVDEFGELATVSLDRERIANVEDYTFPAATFRQNLDLKYRDYKRHTFYGLNLFLNAYFEQFPLLLGIRQQDYMDQNPAAPLLTAREQALLIARLASARIRVSDVRVDETSSELVADVTVANLAGHKLPSGVGFRRAFIELLVLDAAGEPLWASGRTSSLGILQDGLTDEDLGSEFFQADPDSECPQAYQPHYQEITETCQVQIYEELVQDSDGSFTTSFIHRVEHVKDNRLLPRGYRTVAADGDQPAYCEPWCAEPNPDGGAVDDPDYQEAGPLGVEGRDTVRYRIALTSDQLARAATVQVTLYSQSTAPYFLGQRFDSGKAGPRSEDSKRLYFVTGHLNTEAAADDGTAYIEQYKLMLHRASVAVASGSEDGGE